MFRRLLVLSLLAFATVAAASCTSPTAPKQDCAVTVGSGCR
jgi:hypothetical protein